MLYARVMQSIQTILEYDSNLLFLAPTGWGKTTLLLDLAKNTEKSIVYLSPLRALANEFHVRCLENKLSSFAPRKMKELNQAIKGGLNFKLFVLTVEIISEEILGDLLEDKIIVFDEFHLFYYWGKSFRPKLMEISETVMGNSLPALLLTATASEEVVEFWKSKTNGYENRYLMNLGNQQIKKEPKSFYLIPKKDWAFKHLELSMPGIKLVFCQYRQEAKGLADTYNQKGFTALSCVSGEVEEFQRQMSVSVKIDYIFCTSTLSHGVNLPEISWLYITYKVDSLDMWLQMAGRAGRRGEEFCLISRQRGKRSYPQAIISLFNFLCHYGVKKIGRVIHALRRHYHS